MISSRQLLVRSGTLLPIGCLAKGGSEHACLGRGMDNYRDLVSAALALLCAGVMLVAGHLWIEWHARHADPGLGVEVPRNEGPPLPVMSNSSPNER